MRQLNYGTIIRKFPVVKTSHGQIRGENRSGVAVFRGIPYGADCGGANRFLPVGPAADWEGVRDCTKNGPIAVQYGCSISAQEGGFGAYFSGKHPEQMGTDDEYQSENCLVLNVLTPGLDNKKRPVVVYTHGGGFASGSGTLVLGADNWCREEDIVVVGINHRLNVFGYLYLGGLDERYAQSGMAGVLDMVLALEWVRDNITAFGGDPEKVTIMGESGGGAKVNHLCALPQANNLFRASITESGSGIPWSVDPAKATESTKKFLDELGIPYDQLDKLADVSTEDILRVSSIVGHGIGSPVADGKTVFYNAEMDYTETVPSRPKIVGASEEEMAAWLSPLPGGMTWEDLRDRLLGKGKWASVPQPGHGPDTDNGITEENVDKIIEVFRNSDPKQKDPEHLYYRITSMRGMLGGGAYRQTMCKAQKQDGPVWSYFVKFDAPLATCPEVGYAWHTADLPLQMRVVLHDCCEEISKTMAHAWAAFIRTGDPSTPELPWPQFTVENPMTMVFDDICRVERDPTAAYRYTETL